VAFAAVQSPQKAVELLQEMRSLLGERFTAFELISNEAYQLVCKYFPASPKLFNQTYPYYVLMEAADGGSNEALTEAFQGALEIALEKELILDVALSSSVAQAKEIWQVRENISEAQQIDGINIKHDISMAISDIPEYIDQVSAALISQYDGVRIFIYGHLGDGNLHLNASAPVGISLQDWQKKTHEVNEIVHSIVHGYGGSISAEHGIGQAKHDDLLNYKSTEELAVMREIKKALDPKSILNPGKVISV
jgi:FAD/FMN-containing dehydrogenase